MHSIPIRRHALAPFVVTIVAIVLAALAAAGPAAAQTGSTTLQAVVGPDPTITLTRDGEPVTSLEAGTYTIEVDDRSENHNFHLTGAGVDETTTVPEVTTTTWTVELIEGTYTFVCDPHAQNMRGSFTVTAAAAAEPAEPTAEPAQPTTPTQPTATPEQPAEGLPFTGLDTVAIAWLGASLLTGGLVLVVLAGRNEPAREKQQR